MSRKAVCPFIHNSLADTSALAWLPVFEDLGNSSPVNGVSNGSITTFLQTSPSIPAVMFSPFMSSINSSPFGQNKTCCKLNESLQTIQRNIISDSYWIPEGLPLQTESFFF